MRLHALQHRAPVLDRRDIAGLVEKFKRAVQKDEQFRVGAGFTLKTMTRACGLVYEIALARDPVMLHVAPSAGNRVKDYAATVVVRAEICPGRHAHQ